MEKYFFVKSIYTGQVHLATEMPKFNGWVLSDAKEFNEYYLSKGMNPQHEMEVMKSMLNAKW